MASTVPVLGPADSRLSRARVIGQPVSVGSLDAVVEEILRLAALRRPGHVCVANVHMVTEARATASLARALETAVVVTSDGRPLLWSLRRQGFAHAEQARGPSLMPRLLDGAARLGLPVYVYGGDQEVADRLARRLPQRHPGLVLAGVEAPPRLAASPPFDAATAARIRNSGARLVLVGLGCPKQEHWMATHAAATGALAIGVGQALAIAAGTVSEAPPTLQRLGLEWLFRLASEPRRLWRRYLVGNVMFVAYGIGERLRRRLASSA